METPLFPGKLPPGLLKRLTETYTTSDERVVIGSKLGEDATVIDFHDTYLVAKTDPITFATDQAGWYAVNVNANDIAAMGARPKWFLATALLPERDATPQLAEEIFRQISQASSSLGIAFCGGHTEITYGLDRPILIGCMLGEVPKEGLVRSSGLIPGDRIILTKGLGIEATSIIAREKEEQLKEKWGKEFVQRCKDYLYKPGISVVKDSEIACATARIKAMHDPTEGGVATGLWELAQASQVGIEIYGERLYISEESKALCEEFDIVPLGAISSGALLIGVNRTDVQPVLQALRRAEIESEEIGQAKDKDFGLRLNTKGKLSELPRFDRDEITKLFEG